VIKNFDVLDYDPLCSDVHYALQLSFSVDKFIINRKQKYNHGLFSTLFFSQNDFLHLLPNTLAEVCLKIFLTDPKGLWKILNNIDKKKNLMLVIM
jgi:hypothetical protein